MTIHLTAFLADSAEAVNGKLYVLGAGWDTLAAPSFPTVQPRIAIGVIVHVGWNDTDTEHELALRLETEDGQLLPLAGDGSDPGTAVVQLGQRFTAHRFPGLTPGADQAHPLTFTINNLRVPHSGGYSWALLVDGNVAHRLPMHVATLEP
ncbi:DUF6941 family protein [Curtobacterium sp. L1-20]|uniref:DUF6941 family protein n=1 Tax=Curtobacterium sp. L1-20 TaxID=3138181 RepID=UPI003B528A51